MVELLLKDLTHLGLITAFAFNCLNYVVVDQAL